MNPETRELLQKLEQATSRGDVDASCLDDETAQLREGWLALGQILDESKSSAWTGSSLICGSDDKSLPVAPTHRAKATAHRVGWIVACAMGLLVAVFAAWYAVGGIFSVQSPSTPIAGHQESPDAAGTMVPDSGTGGVPIGDAPSGGPDGESVTELAWDDAWDDQLAQTGYAIWQAGGAAPNHDQAWSYLFSELQLISSDLEGGSL